MIRGLILAVVAASTPAAVLAQPPAPAAARIDKNVVFGMYSGLALLMDVHYPPHPNGRGVVLIGGSGFYSAQSYDARSLKDGPQTAMYGRPLLEAGYVVFAINHRAQPRFRYPAAVEDSQRAVRFIRHHAAEFGIDPRRIGAVGGSSGGYLVSMLGVLDGDGNASDPDPVGRESAKVQCVVARAAPADLVNIMRNAAASFMGMPVEIAGTLLPATSVEYKTYVEASPITHVSKDDAPLLLMHGDADTIVPFKNSEAMLGALEHAGVASKLLRIPGGNHGPDFPGANAPPDYMAEMVRWLDQHLRQH